MTPELVTTAEIATRFSVTRQTVLNWVDAGKITPVLRLKASGALLFDPADVDKLSPSDAGSAASCPVHEPGDSDCTPTFGAPCIGASLES